MLSHETLHPADEVSMKNAMLLAALVLACAPKADQPASDSAAMAAGPAPLTAADIAGTWNGISMAETSDSVLARWTMVSANGTDSKGVMQGTTDSVSYTHAFESDSFVVISAPHAVSTLPGNPQVIDRGAGRLTAGKLHGTGTVVLASKPDSILLRYRWEATKSP